MTLTYQFGVNMTFDQIKIGESFYLAGTAYIKKSTRTAYIFGMPHRWFYFSKNDTVYTSCNDSKQHVEIFFY